MTRRYRKVPAKMIDRGEQYEIYIYCPNVKDEFIKEITIRDSRLLIHIGYALIKYRHRNIEVIAPAYAYNIYLPIPRDAEKIISWRIRNGALYVKVGGGDRDE